MESGCGVWIRARSLATTVVVGVHYQYDVSLECEQFLIVTGSDSSETPINATVNWQAATRK